MSYNSEEYFNSGDFKALLKKFEEAEEAGFPVILDSEEFVDIAEYYYNNGETDRACEIIDRTTEMYPGATAPLLFKARMAFLDYNDTEKAKSYIDQIEDKTDLEYYYIKAEIMIFEGFKDKADKYLEECFAEVDDEDKDFFAIDVAAIFLDYAAPEKAGKWLLRSKETESAEYLEQYARIMFDKGDYETSKVLFNKLIDKDPYSTQYWNSLASSQFFCHDIEDSIDSSEYALAINPDNPTALLNKANGLYRLGNHKEALLFYQKYNKVCPDDENGEMLLGYCHIILENYEEAAMHLEKAANLLKDDDPNITEIHKEWAYSVFRSGKLEKALSILDDAIKRGCDKNLMLVYRGNLLYESGEIKEGNACFVKAIKDSGGSTDIILKVAITLFDCKDITSAYNIFRFLYTRNSDLREGYAYYAACCYILDEKEKFLSSLKKAVEYNPEEARQTLGYIFPEGMDVEDYYQYMLKQIRKDNPSI